MNTSNITLTASSPVVVALDVDNEKACLALARKLSPKLCRVKVGKELFTACGPRIVEQLQHLGFEVFLDLKFHDIPVTTAKAVKTAAQLGVWMVNVHASGGMRMMSAASEAIANVQRKPLLIGVTVLTSSTQQELSELGIERTPEQQVLHLAGLVKNAGLDGVVCSAQEATALRAQNGRDFALVTPGIRPAGSDNQDQRRVMTPEQAMQAGSHYLVIGRPITQAADPIAVCEQIVHSLTFDHTAVESK
ncbi:orotidine-5'-phosphate decarboxylase [Marinagarivorans algicola]|uniref:orotidine-5'-phosphate decarboxylase n=1 Tax=Marinagarivorans algicola TaxID=1513270 RepID=UPI001EE3AF3B|nr:orotidine-5'-phosphate decarboxylase [Marinagarivorans algicola]